ncbi:MAG: hypothetical protein WBC33_06630 [Conexibacter sp.]
MAILAWLAVVPRVVVVVRYILHAVDAVELLAGARRGREKQDAAVDVTRAMLAAAEAGADRDLLDDADVEQATRGLVDAVVALQNVLAKKRAAVVAAREDFDPARPHLYGSAPEHNPETKETP